MKGSELVPKRGGVKRRRKVEATDLIRRIQSRAHQRKGGEGADSLTGLLIIAAGISVLGFVAGAVVGRRGFERN